MNSLAAIASQLSTRWLRQLAFVESGRALAREAAAHRLRSPPTITWGPGERESKLAYAGVGVAVDEDEEQIAKRQREALAELKLPEAFLNPDQDDASLRNAVAKAAESAHVTKISTKILIPLPRALALAIWDLYPGTTWGWASKRALRMIATYQLDALRGAVALHLSRPGWRRRKRACRLLGFGGRATDGRVGQPGTREAFGELLRSIEQLRD